MASTSVLAHTLLQQTLLVEAARELGEDGTTVGLG